jgi:hypothetical protein
MTRWIGPHQRQSIAAQDIHEARRVGEAGKVASNPPVIRSLTLRRENIDIFDLPGRLTLLSIFDISHLVNR